MELRGFEPLTPSMRTLGGEVVRGRWGRSAAGGSLSEPLAVGDVAVLRCCTAAGLAPMTLCDSKPAYQQFEGGESIGFIAFARRSDFTRVPG